MNATYYRILSHYQGKDGFWYLTIDTQELDHPDSEILAITDNYAAKPQIHWQDQEWNITTSIGLHTDHTNPRPIQLALRKAETK
jgi:hypothetical protein